jgi:uncharacterized protein
MHPLIEKNLKNIQSLCAQHHIKSLHVFGSVARNDFSPSSDIDFLYEMDYSGLDLSKPLELAFDPLTEFFELKDKLEKLLGRQVDLIANGHIRNKYLLESITQDSVKLYEA